MITKGFGAYRTLAGMNMHFGKSGYDGWKYNFKTSISEEKYSQNKQLVYQYAAIERDFPFTIDQLKFYYPSFRDGNTYVRPDNVKIIWSNYKRFNLNIINDNFLLFIGQCCDSMAGVHFFKDLKNPETLYYFFQHSKGILIESVCLSYMVFGTLNSDVNGQSNVLYEIWETKRKQRQSFVNLLYPKKDLDDLILKTSNLIKSKYNLHSKEI